MKSIVTWMALLLMAGSAAAETGRTFTSGVETDPFAYVFGGYSLHAAVETASLRFSLGAFAVDQPASIHGNDGFSNYASGFGLKADYFFRSTDGGLHVGLSTDVIREEIRHEATNDRHDRRILLAGGRVGYRLALYDGLYLDPWVGVSYVFGAEDVRLGGERYASTPVLIFPTIHLGYRF